MAIAHNNKTPPEQQHGLRVLVILSALMAFASISTDLYLPALPVMGASLHANAGLIALTISGYLIGFSLGQLAWGPVSDRIGRRLPIAIGLVLFIIGSAGCAESHSAGMLIGWRIVQAIGASASVVLARAMVRDLYAGYRASQIMSTLMTVMAIAPLVGPILGGQILHVASWRAIFWLLVAVGALTLVALTTLPETLPQANRNQAPLSHALKDYLVLLVNPRILAYAGAGGFFYAGMFAYIAGTPFAYISYYHVSPQAYGMLFGAAVLGIMATNQLNAWQVRRFGGDRLMLVGAAIAAVAAMVLARDAWTGAGGLVGIVLPLLLFVAMTGFIVANSISGALNTFPKQAGAVSALVGAMQYGSGVAGSALVGLLADGTPWPMGIVMAVMAVGCLGCAFLVGRRSSGPALA